MARWAHIVSVLLPVLVLAGCSSPPPPPTKVDLTLSASSDVNPTAGGQAAPVVVRVYQLASASGFEGAEFFALFNQDQSVLKTDLVKKDEFLLSPGQNKTTTLMPTDQVTTLGIFAAYRDFQHTKWRATVPIPAHKTTAVTVTIGHDGVVAKAVPAKAGP
jgi:type VI secretion system protein VasD